MAAPTHTLSGSRFLRPKLSRFFNQVAQVRPRISRIVEGAAALMPPMPDFFSSMFYTKPRTPPPGSRHHTAHAWPLSLPVTENS